MNLFKVSECTIYSAIFIQEMENDFFWGKQERSDSFLMSLQLEENKCAKLSNLYSLSKNSVIVLRPSV